MSDVIICGLRITNETIMPPRSKKFAGELSSSTLIIRNVVVMGKRMSLRLEPEMWDALVDVCSREGVSVHDTCSKIAESKPAAASMTAAIRVFLVEYYRLISRLDSAENQSTSIARYQSSSYLNFSDGFYDLMLNLRSKFTSISPLRIAEYFIFLSWKHDAPITNIDLNKLMYYLDGWNLVFFNETIFEDYFVAKSTGPVLLSISDKFNQYNYSAIPYQEILSDDFSFLSVRVIDLAFRVFTTYHISNPDSITRMETIEGSPWHQTWIQVQTASTSDMHFIAKESTQRWFLGILNASLEAEASKSIECVNQTEYLDWIQEGKQEYLKKSSRGKYTIDGYL